MNGNDFSSDAELGEGLRRGEPRAEEVFLERILPVVVRRLRRYMGGSEREEHPDMADSVSRIVRRVAKRMTGPDPVSNLTSYVLTAADNEGKDWRKQDNACPSSPTSMR